MKSEIPEGTTDLDYVDKRQQDYEEKLSQIHSQISLKNTQLKDKLEQIRNSNAEELASFDYNGENSYIPGQKDGVDLRKKKLDTYNGPIDPKDADYYEDYHNRIQHPNNIP